MCVACICEVENKSSVKYEVIAQIISIINQRFVGGAAGDAKKKKVEEKGKQKMKAKREENMYFLIYLESSRM